MFTHCSAPLRWKQHEAYVQVLEAKYADLCCKYICCNRNIIPRNVNRISPASMTHRHGRHILHAAFGRFFSSDALSFSSPLHHRSQRCDRTEGVRGEAQAAAAGVRAQGEHPGHATCHQGAGNARVHRMYLLLHQLLVIAMIMRSAFFICLRARAVDAVS